MYKLIRKIRKALPSSSDIYYYSNKYYYEKLSARYNDIESYLKLRSISSRLSPVESKLDIKPELGTDIEHTLRKYGKPRHRLSQMTPLSIQILFYKFMIGGQKTKCELHFFKNKLFLLNYTFSYLDPDNKTKINDLLCSKYLETLVDLKTCKIRGKNGNEIFLLDASDLTICYLTGSEFFQEAQKLKDNRQLEKDSLSDRNNRDLLRRL